MINTERLIPFLKETTLNDIDVFKFMNAMHFIRKNFQIQNLIFEEKQKITQSCEI